MKLEQAARQALEALIDSDDGGGLRYTEVQAVAALREALAEPVSQEPAGTAGELFTMSALERLDVRPSTKVYLNTAPVRTKDLTDDELERVWFSTGNASLANSLRAVIAADREKNK